MRIGFFPLVASLALSIAMAPFAARAEFTAQQRAEIVQIVREALKADPTILRDAVAAFQADEAAKEKASAKDALVAMRDRLVTADDPVAGNPKGDVTIVEFFDVRCPYCKNMEPEMAKFLAGDKKVRLVYKDLPILGAPSTLGAKALLAAKRQNAYEKLRDAVMKLPSANLTQEGLEAAAKQVGLDAGRLRKDMEDPAIRKQLDENLALAHALAIQGTPALIIGDELVPGTISADELKRLVAAARKAG